MSNFNPNFNISLLLESAVHFGHKKNLWNPKMEPYIYGIKNKTHIIDLRKTANALYSALQLVYKVASENGRILFVNTKKQSTDLVEEAAMRCGQYYINWRWLGGMLTNWRTVSSSIKTLENYERLLSEDLGYTKKELLNFSRKKEKLEKAIGGVRNLGGTPDLIFIIDVKLHSIAVQEAKLLGIPIVAVVDTNSDPSDVDYVIPGNDDSRKSIKLYCDLVADAALEGLKKATCSDAKQKEEKPRDRKVEKKVSRENLEDK